MASSRPRRRADRPYHPEVIPTSGWACRSADPLVTAPASILDSATTPGRYQQDRRSSTVQQPRLLLSPAPTCRVRRCVNKATTATPSTRCTRPRRHTKEVLCAAVAAAGSGTYGRWLDTTRPRHPCRLPQQVRRRRCRRRRPRRLYAPRTSGLLSLGVLGLAESRMRHLRVKRPRQWALRSVLLLQCSRRERQPRTRTPGCGSRPTWLKSGRRKAQKSPQARAASTKATLCRPTTASRWVRFLAQHFRQRS